MMRTKPAGKSDRSSVKDTAGLVKNAVETALAWLSWETRLSSQGFVRKHPEAPRRHVRRWERHPRYAQETYSGCAHAAVVPWSMGSICSFHHDRDAEKSNTLVVMNWPSGSMQMKMFCGFEISVESRPGRWLPPPLAWQAGAAIVASFNAPGILARDDRLPKGSPSSNSITMPRPFPQCFDDVETVTTFWVGFTSSPAKTSL